MFHTEPKIKTENLPVELTTEEIRYKGQELAQKLKAKKTIEDNKKASMAAYKERLDEVQAQINQLEMAINEGKEDRAVEVRSIPDLNRSCYSIIRSDTGEEVRIKHMTPNEKQDLLDGVIDFMVGEEGVPVEKEIVSTEYDSDPFAPDEAETSQRDPREWISIEDERPDPQTLVETGLYSEDTERVESCLMNGYVSADADVAWNKYTDPHTLPTDPSEPRFEEWDITHFRYIQPDTDAPTEEGEAD